MRVVAPNSESKPFLIVVAILAIFVESKEHFASFVASVALKYGTAGTNITKDFGSTTEHSTQQ